MTGVHEEVGMAINCYPQAPAPQLLARTAQVVQAVTQKGDKEADPPPFTHPPTTQVVANTLFVGCLWGIKVNVSANPFTAALPVRIVNCKFTANVGESSKCRGSIRRMILRDTVLWAHLVMRHSPSPPRATAQPPHH